MTTLCFIDTETTGLDARIHQPYEVCYWREDKAEDRILFGNVTGAGVPTVSPFHAEAIFHAQKHGFDYLGMRTIVTDVVRENNQTYRLGWTEMSKDATKMGSGSPEYVLLFHKPQSDRTKGYADEPVTKDKAEYTRARWQVDAHAFWRSSGDRPLTPDELGALPPDQMSRLFTEQTIREVYDYESHVRIGEALDGRGKLPATFMSLAPGSWHREVWHDVNRILTLNTEQSRKAQAQHVCPLQFDVVDRLIRLYSNEGDLIYDPFGGLFTVALRALKLGRRGRAVGVKYLQAEEAKRDMPSLFDLTEGVVTTLHGDCIAPPGARRYCAVCLGTWTSSAGVEHVCEHECHQEDE